MMENIAYALSQGIVAHIGTLNKERIGNVLFYYLRNRIQFRVSVFLSR